ncbi:MAG: M48 family metalloprotease [Rhodospirillales bacterium]
MSFIRDAEIENTIRSYAAPLFQAAGLEPSAIEIYLVNDNSLNAFVAGGQKLFLNTGLLMRSEHPGQLIGVIAHETGHISGGHLSRIHAAIEKSSAASVLSYVLGGAATIATGRADLGQAIIMGGQQVGVRSFLKYSRTQESSADQAALTILENTKQSARGLLEFTKILSGQELLSPNRQDPYLRTHPLTRDRIAALEAHVAKSPYSDIAPPPDFQKAHRRMLAKLRAFTESFAITMRRYKETDASLESRYARAIALYRHSKLEEAVVLVDSLISEYPIDPYFHELKGQMMFENGRVAEAMASYETAVRLLPGSPLLRYALAQAQIESNDKALLEPAIANLRGALEQDSDSPATWRSLAIAYGRQGNMGMSSLAMAEEALLMGKPADAVYYAGRAEKLLPAGTTVWLQAQDILQAAKAKQK